MSGSVMSQATTQKRRGQRRTIQLKKSIRGAPMRSVRTKDLPMSPIQLGQLCTLIP